MSEGLFRYTTWKSKPCVQSEEAEEKDSTRGRLVARWTGGKRAWWQDGLMAISIVVKYEGSVELKGCRPVK